MTGRRAFIQKYSLDAHLQMKKAILSPDIILFYAKGYVLLVLSGAQVSLRRAWHGTFLGVSSDQLEIQIFSGVVSDYKSSKEDGGPSLHCIGDTGLGKGHSLGHGRPHCNPGVKTHLSTSLSNCSSAWSKKKFDPPPALADCHQQEECGRVAQEVLFEARQSPMLSPSSSVPTSPAKCIVEILLS